MTAPAQELSSARSIAIGAATLLAGDVSAIDANPAALARMSDWEFSMTGYFPLAGNDRAGTFQSIGVGRRISPLFAAGFRFTPGHRIEFVVPTTFIYDDSSTTFVTRYDKKVSYEERLGAGLAWAPTGTFAAGVSFHYIEEQVSGTRYAIDTSSFIRASAVDFSGTIWTVDLGALWRPGDIWRFGATVTNALPGLGSRLPALESAYQMELPRVLRAGAAYRGWSGLALAADVDTRSAMHAGAEWMATPTLALRAGAYASSDSAFQVDAIAVGAGMRFNTVRVDLSYLAFLDQANRRGSADIDRFRASDLNGIAYNAFTSDRVTLTATLNVGSRPESVVRIESVDLVPDVYPANRALYAYLPVGTAHVRNGGTRTVDARLSVWVDGYMDLPTETQVYRLAPGDTLSIPFTAVFNDKGDRNRKIDITEAEITLHATPEDGVDDRVVRRLLVRGRNDWNGDAATLRYFVTPGDPEVMRYARAALVPHKAMLDTLPGMLQNAAKARLVFDALARDVTYVGDPAQSADFVQYPLETLRLKTGDCDDMSVAVASLLGSMGITTAFVDVVPPEHPEKAHVYVMFDTGLDPSYASRLSPNPKRFVVRKDDRGTATLWLPLETTAVRGGFEEAWKKGSEEWLQESEVELGLVKGWLRVVDAGAVN